MNSIDSANQKRDEHLRNADFFNVEKFPLITFTSKKVKATGKQKFRVSGDLMMHGVTKDIPVDLEFIGVEKDPWGNRRAGFLVTGKVNRKDFGIVWNKTLESGNLLLGESVDINVQIEAIEQTPKAAEKAS